MVLPPAGPPPPSLPEGWKAHWNAEYKAWFYENIYTEESVWEKPTQPVYPPLARAPLPPGPPPGDLALQQLTLNEKSGDITSPPKTTAAVTSSDTNPSLQPPQLQEPYGPPTYTPPAQQLYNSIPPPNINPPQNAPPSTFNAVPQSARAPSPQPAAPGLGLADTTRDYNPQRVQYPQQPTYPNYPTQQSPSPGYSPQPQYSPQPNYPTQPQYAQVPPPPQPEPAQKGNGFMGMLQNKVGNKVPGGAGTVLGLGGGLLAGAVLEHEWDKHEDRERRRHHRGFGGLGGLMRGFGGDSGPPIVENVTINEDVYVDENNNSFFGF